MSIEVSKPGIYTTVQDLGRYQYRGLGVPVSGAMDQFAVRAANMLVGNAAGAAALEITMVGPELKFRQDALLAICGADMEPRIDGQKIPMWRPIVVRKGHALQLSRTLDGCRAYIAFAGGISVPAAMGSRSTLARGGIGGAAGRALAAGDMLEIDPSTVDVKAMIRSRMGSNGTERHLSLTEVAHGSPSEPEPDSSVGWAAASWYVSSAIRPAYKDGPVVRIIRGREAACFTQASLNSFLSEAYSVSPHSDRMGYRLQGEALELVQPLEMITEAAAPGTIQVPPDGQPILLMSDCQTTGGYPRVAHVISVDLPLVAQLKPGGAVRFREVSLREAQEQLLLREMELRLLQAGVRGRLAGLLK